MKKLKKKKKKKKKEHLTLSLTKCCTCTVADLSIFEMGFIIYDGAVYWQGTCLYHIVLKNKEYSLKQDFLTIYNFSNLCPSFKSLYKRFITYNTNIVLFQTFL